jgi:hypothetical protein
MSCTVVDGFEYWGGGGVETAFSVRRLVVSQRGRVACYVEREREERLWKNANFHKFAKPSVLFSVTRHLAPLGQREC